MEALARQAANKMRAVVVSVDYRLAPEHKFPTAVQDAVDTLCWAAQTARSLGADASRIVVMGDSAGGHLAAVATLSASRGPFGRSRGGETLRLPRGAKLAAQILLNPVIVPFSPYASHVRLTQGPIVGNGFCTWMWLNYLADPLRQSADPRASPMLDTAVKWSRVPPTVIVTGHFDVLADEGDAYAEHLLARGVPVVAARRLEAHSMNAPDTLEWAFASARRLVDGEAVDAPPESKRSKK